MGIVFKLTAGVVSAIAIMGAVNACTDTSSSYTPSTSSYTPSTSATTPSTSSTTPAPASREPKEINWNSYEFSSDKELIREFETKVGAKCDTPVRNNNGTSMAQCTTSRGNTVMIGYAPAGMLTRETLIEVGKEMYPYSYLVGTNWIMLAESVGNMRALTERLGMTTIDVS